MIHRAYKYRLYPTDQQEIELNKIFGCVRFVWNQLVANFNSYPNYNPNLNEKILKENPNHFFLTESIASALQQKRRDFNQFKKQYFSKKRKKKLGKPKFKSKHAHKDSFRISSQAIGYERCINWELGLLKITKLDPIRIILDRKFTGKPLSATISRNPSGQYFASILVEEETPSSKPLTGKSIGIDLGLNHLLTLSDGAKVDNPRWFRENQTKLKRSQKHLSRKKKDTRRREKQRIKVARIHQKTSNRRKWFYHDLANRLISKYDVICLESLSVAGMVRSKNMGKSVSDAAWSTFTSILKYKASWYGKQVYHVDWWFPSSKTCSCCSYVHDSWSRGISEWTCPACGSHHDRDINAAKNILQQGMADLNLPSAECVDYARGEIVRSDLI